MTARRAAGLESISFSTGRIKVLVGDAKVVEKTKGASFGLKKICAFVFVPLKIHGKSGISLFFLPEIKF